MLTWITTRGFRNLGDTRWEPGGGPHLLVGPNGAGKTSLLEALYLLATSRSFRTSRIDECRRIDEDSFSLFGRVESDARIDLGIEWGPDGRRLSMNGKATTGVRYLEALPVICWSATDLQVLEGGPWYRRRFLDQGIVGGQPAAVEVLSRYRRALEQKRELLRRSGQGIEAWNDVLSKAATALISRRASFVSLLQKSLEDTVEASGLAIPQVRLQYRPSPAASEITVESLSQAFSAAAPREMEEGRVLLGPHRDELVITWGNVEISKIASAGEKKLVGILLCAARGKVLSRAGRQPIVLLDDVDAELDLERLTVVWKLFSTSPQIVATTCHESVIDNLPEARIWRLESGLIGSPGDS